MRSFSLLLAGLALHLLAASPAFAHAHLRSAVPPPDATLAAAPPAIELTFTEDLEPRFSTLRLQDAAGQQIALPAAAVAGDNPRQLVVRLPALRPGTYTVVWQVVSIDTHRTEGRYTFSIRGQ